eukprot:451981_1
MNFTQADDTSIIIAPTYVESASEEIVSDEDKDEVEKNWILRTNQNVMIIQQKRIVYGYLRMQQQHLFCVENRNSAYYNLHTIAVVICKFYNPFLTLFQYSSQRIFTLLDRDCDNVLNFNELQYFNEQILGKDFNVTIYNILLRRLNEQSFVTPQGVTLLGFRHLMKRFTIAKNWDRCWDINDFTLHKRVFPVLPKKENDQTFELSNNVFLLLE